ncbi:MAG: hypothetical protein JEY99_16575 [Spirochaetales bacterium]|nr:hypothetical protein [Spirochaetales bacterium]
MKKLYKKLKTESFLIISGTIILPVSFLIPFALLVGFFTVEQFTTALRNPAMYLLVFGNVAIIAVLIHLIMDKTVKSASPGWDELKRMGLRLVSLFWVYCIVTLGIILITANFITTVDVPHYNLYAFIFGLAFILISCVPFSSFLVTDIERVIRMEIPDEERIFLPLNTKIIVLVGADFLGTIILYVTLQMILSTVIEMGRTLPFGPTLPFFVAGVVSLAVLAIILRIILKLIAAPINSVSANFRTAASGNFTDTIEAVTVDEVGRMSVHANKLTESLNNSFYSFHDSVTNIETAKDSLSANVEEISGAIEQINQNLENTDIQMQDHSAHIAETTAAVEQLARNISSLGEHISQQSRLVERSDTAVTDLLSANDQLDSLAETGHKRTDKLVEVASEGNRQINSMAARIRQINESSEHLIEANTLIAAVSSQTNLLAMNAAIEAAHAGASGKGFAVVADEIRKLAETSAAQSKNIGQNLKEVLGQIGSVESESHEVLTSFDEITSHVQDVRTAVDSINEFTSTIRQISGDIRLALGEISTVSQSINTGSDEMQQGNVEILKAVTNMRDISQRVMESVSEITLGSK